jgi:hypothetical protein
MIWFGKLPGFPPVPAPRADVVWETDFGRMEYALQWVAARSPHLYGSALVEAVVGTGWVDRRTAERLLPHFRHFDADRYFADNLRRLAFGGAPGAEEFRAGICRAVEDIAGTGRFVEDGASAAIRFSHGEHEGVVLAYPEVSLTVSGATRDAVLGVASEMPDMLVIVARNFHETAAMQLSGVLSGTEVPGTLVTVNLLLGMRATALRYQPGPARVLELLGAGRPLRSTDVARLGDRN